MTEQDQPPAGNARVEPIRNEAQAQTVPWSAREGWISVLLLALINVGLFVFISKSSRMQLAQSALVVIAELAYILPVVVILAWKRIHWRNLGFGKFDWGTMGIGCGMLIGGYGIIFVHNVTLTLLGVDTQGQAFLDFFSSLDSPVWLILAVVVIAPVVEEVFFRGFLFQGFRKKYGWVSALLLSSGIFAAAHLDPVSLVPTFVLGVVLTYVYHRSNSVWPGVILHFLVNASSTCSFYVLMQSPNLFPS